MDANGPFTRATNFCSFELVLDETLWMTDLQAQLSHAAEIIAESMASIGRQETSATTTTECVLPCDGHDDKCTHAHLTVFRPGAQQLLDANVAAAGAPYTYASHREARNKYAGK